MSSSSDFMLLHRIIRFVTGTAADSFFREIRVIGEENVPVEGPIIVTATHHNMMLDPTILSHAFPHHRIINYWSKASLFGHPVVAAILYSSGNIPVDRKSKDRQKLFKGTFKALSTGNAVGLFPEGTSYTEPRIMQIKDGAAWAALEYTKWKKDHPELANQPGVKIIPAAIVYTNKSKYRSGVILEFGKAISMDEYEEQFLSEAEGASRAAVKRLSRTIESELVEATINAPDWDTLYAARMARDLMWVGEDSIPLDDFVVISQTLVDLFSNADIVPSFKNIRRHLLSYYALLQSSHLTNSVLASLPLPASLDPRTPATTPSRLYTLLILFRDSVAAIIGLPFFFLPLLVHLPVYIMGRFGAKLVEDEEETQAQNKITFGIISTILVYSLGFFFLWALFWYTPMGALLSGSLLYFFARYHTRMIDGNYERAKRFVAAWRVLVGIWTPRRFDLSLGAVAQFMTPKVPKPNQWVDQKRRAPQSDAEDGVDASKAPERTSSPTDLQLQKEPPVKARSVRRPPSRRLVRHVLRARVEAINALASLFDQLEQSGGQKVMKSSPHLARAFGGSVVPQKVAEGANESDGANLESYEGYRGVKEVVAFLRQKGAKIPTLRNGRFEGDWAAALSSDGEESSWSTQDDSKEDLVWVPPPQSDNN